MKIKLKNNVVHAADVGPSSHHKKGDVIEVDDKVGKSLVSRGDAVAHKDEPAKADPAKPDPAKK